jgi:hypothetical protein
MFDVTGESDEWEKYYWEKSVQRTNFIT